MFKIIITSEQLDLPRADLYITGVNTYVWVWPMKELRAKMLAEHYKDIPEVVSEQETTTKHNKYGLELNPDELEAPCVLLSASDGKVREHNTLWYIPKRKKTFKEYKYSKSLKKLIGGLI